MRPLLPLIALALVACSPDLRTFDCDDDNDCPGDGRCTAGVCQPVDAEDGGDASDAGDGGDSDPSDTSGSDPDVDGEDGDAVTSVDCGTDASGTAPTVDWGTFPTVLTEGTHRYHATLTFSEPVWGVDRRSVTIDNGAIIWNISTTDRRTWTFDIAGLWATGEFMVSLSSAIQNAAGVSLAEAGRSRSFTVDRVVYYVAKNGEGEGLNPGDPMCCIQEGILAAALSEPKADVLVATGDYDGPIQLLAGVGVFGGFSSTFSERDSEFHETTILTTTVTTVSAESLFFDDEATLDGFTLINTDHDSPSVTVALDLSEATISHNAIRRSEGGTGGNFAVSLNGPGGLVIENEIEARGTGLVVGLAYINDGDGAGPRPRIYFNDIEVSAESGPAIATGVRLRQSGPTPAEVVGNQIGAGLGSEDAKLVGLELRAEAYIFNNLISGAGPGATCLGISVFGGSGLIVHNIVDGGTCEGETTAISLDEDADVSLVNNILFTTGTGTTDSGVFELAAISDPLAFRNNVIFDVESLYVDEAGSIVLTDIDDVNTGLDATVERVRCADSCETAQVGGNVTLDATSASFFVSLGGDDFLPHTLDDNDWHYALPDLDALGLDTASTGCGTIQSPASCGNVTDDADGVLRTVPVSVGAYEREPECP